MRKIRHILVKLFSSFFWIILGTILVLAIFRFAQTAGVIPTNEFIAGTGSMYPTFPKGNGKTEVERIAEVVATTKVRSYPGGVNLFGLHLFNYTLRQGDIVSFANNKTADIINKEASGSAKNTGFIKRVIGLPKDTIEIRDGFVWINGKVLNEPYTATPRSTYGGSFLPDCQKVSVPMDSVFVLGDNRKGSDDSRFDIGFVKLADIKTVIPLVDQGSTSKKDGLKAHWRDTAHDLDQANQPLLDPQEYLKLLNQKRQESKLKPLTYQPLLSQSASLRADNIIKYNDFSPEATRSGYTMERALNDAGYSNIIYGEAPTKGFYTAGELIENYFQFPDSRQFLLNSQYQETGVSAKLGSINGCPVQVVVQHFAGYIPPNYSTGTINSWQNLVSNLDNVIPGWERARGESGFNQDDLSKLLSLLHTRRDRASSILQQMQADKWLTKEQEGWAKGDNDLFSQIESLAKKLNNP